MGGLGSPSHPSPPTCSAQGPGTSLRATTSPSRSWRSPRARSHPLPSPRWGFGGSGVVGPPRGVGAPLTPPLGRCPSATPSAPERNRSAKPSRAAARRRPGRWGVLGGLGVSHWVWGPCPIQGLGEGVSPGVLRVRSPLWGVSGPCRDGTQGVPPVGWGGGPILAVLRQHPLTLVSLLSRGFGVLWGAGSPQAAVPGCRGHPAPPGPPGHVQAGAAADPRRHPHHHPQIQEHPVRHLQTRCLQEPRVRHLHCLRRGQGGFGGLWGGGPGSGVAVLTPCPPPDRGPVPASAQGGG